jgi:hypothetical protein
MQIRKVLRASVIFTIVVLAGVALQVPTTSALAAYGYCMEPRAPSLYASKPSKPYCATSQNCSSFEVEQYRSSIKSYYSQLEQYLVDVDKFRKLAYEYADCEAKSD